MQSYKKVIFLSLSMFFYSLVIGMSSIILPILFKNGGASASIIGYLDNIKIIFGIAVIFILPILSLKIGVVNSAILSLVLYGLPIIILPMVSIKFFWFILIGSYGIGLIIFRLILESVTNIVTKDENRGKVISLISLSMSLGIGSGPFLIKIFGSENYFSFILTASAALIAGLFFYKFKNEDLKIKETRKIEYFKYLKDMPIVFFSQFILEFVCQSLFVFGVIYGIRNGYKAEDAGFFLTAFSLAGYLSNYPVGYLVDRSKKSYLIMVFGVFLALSSLLLLPIFIYCNTLTYLLFFIFGIGTSAILISVMTILNSYYEKEELLAANSALTMNGCFGMIFSSFLTGIFIDIFGANGFIIPFLLLCLAYLYAITSGFKNLVIKNKTTSGK